MADKKVVKVGNEKFVYIIKNNLKKNTQNTLFLFCYLIT